MSEIDLTLAWRFLVALLIGALVGVEREKTHRTNGRQAFAGLRTFILLAMLGALAGWLTEVLATPWVLMTILFAVTVVVVVAYLRDERPRSEAIGVSSEIAAVSVFVLGAVALLGFPQVAVALGIVTSALLAFKEPLHGLVQRIGVDDLYAVLKLLIATFIVLPLLPNRPIDPWEALNPYTLWLLVILISGLSLVGYVAVRMLGESRGTVLTGASGGLVSSTAITLHFAQQSREQGAKFNANAVAAGVFAAWTIMFVRVLITVSVVKADLVLPLLPSFALLTIAGATLTGGFYWRSRRLPDLTNTDGETKLKNPFNLSSAIQFALLFAVVLVVVKLTGDYAPPGGLYLVSLVAGLTDVDAITLSVAQATGESIALREAIIAIALAALANTLTKCTLVMALGRGPIRAYVGWGTLVLVVLGSAAAFGLTG